MNFILYSRMIDGRFAAQVTSASLKFIKKKIRRLYG